MVKPWLSINIHFKYVLKILTFFILDAILKINAFFNTIKTYYKNFLKLKYLLQPRSI